MFLIKLYRDIVPLKLKKIFQLGSRYEKLKELVYLATIQIKHKKALRRLKKKDKINCVFFALYILLIIRNACINFCRLI